MAKVKITGHASGTGILTVTAPNTSTDRTITLPDSTGTLLDETSSLPAANLTGTIANARISEVSVTQHVDLSSVKNDISLLALQTAINGNLSAYGLKNSWIEQFENSTYIENLTNVSRVTSGEFLASVYSTTTTSASSEWSSTTDINFGTGDDMSYSSGDKSTRTNDSFAGDVTVTFTIGSASASNNQNWFGFYDIADSQAFGESDQYGDTNDMTDSWTFRPVTTTVLYGGTSLDTGIAHPAAGSVIKFKRVGTTVSVLDDDVTIYTWGDAASGTLRFFMGRGGAYSAIDNTDISWTVVGADNATGSFNSTDVVPQDATNKSSVGIVILYKDQAGTTTFNGANELVAKVRANTGQAYQEVVLAGAGTYSNGMKIAIAPAIAVTAGQALSYEISFAGQAASSMETRVYGVAMTY